MEMFGYMISQTRTGLLICFSVLEKKHAWLTYVSQSFIRHGRMVSICLLLIELDQEQ